MVRRYVLGSVLMLTAASGFGLSLGPVNGHAIVGQGLNVAVPITLSGAETVADLCAQAQVSFAETPVGSHVVRVSTASGTSGTAVLNIRTLSTLNEPYVLLDVQVGCRNVIARQYVLLADLPAPESSPRSSAATPASSSTPAQVAQPAQVDEARYSPNPASVPNSASAPAPALHPAARAASPGSAQSAVPKPSLSAASAVSKPLASKPVQQTAPRLKLDPVDLSEAAALWMPALRLSPSTIAAVVDADPALQQQREAARALWAQLTVEPGQTPPTAEALKEAERKAQQLQAQLAQAQQQQAALQAQLAQADDDHYLNPLVIGLASLCVLAIAGLVLTVIRSRQLLAGQRQWWKSPEEPAHSGHALSPTATERTDGHDPAFSKWMNRSSRLDVELHTLFPVGADGQGEAGQPPSSLSPDSSSPSEFMPSTLTDANRSVATEELFDLQQQVEFFISLGQTEQAVNVLVTHLSDGQQPSPLAYLDLLKLYHQLNRREAYDALREDFNRYFNGNAPTFDKHAISRRGLERYTKAMSRLQALWPKKEVLTLIEASLFRKPAEQGDLAEHGEVFDLEAYRELLLLYGIARELVAESESQGDTTRLDLYPAPAGAAPAHADAFLPPASVSPVPSAQAVTTLQPLRADMAPARSAATDAAAWAAMDELEAAMASPVDVMLPPATPPAASSATSSATLDIDLSGSTIGSHIRSLGGMTPSVPPPFPAFAPVRPTPPLAPSALHAGVEMTADESDFMPPPHDGGVDSVDLDFSDLGPRTPLTIRKSGIRN